MGGRSISTVNEVEIFHLIILCNTGNVTTSRIGNLEHETVLITLVVTDVFVCFFRSIEYLSETMSFHYHFF